MPIKFNHITVGLLSNGKDHVQSLTQLKQMLMVKAIMVLQR